MYLSEFPIGGLVRGGCAEIALPPGTRERIAESKSSILLACMPKSGSTYLSTLISLASGYAPTGLVYAYDRNEQDIYLPALLHNLTLPSPTITQQHLRATGPNLELIRTFGLQTVVLVRNLFDVLVSLHDHLLHEGFRVPSAFIQEDFAQLPPERRLDMVVDFATPWYLSFYVSWFEAQKRASCPTHWVRYEEMIVKPEAILSEILTYCGVALPQRPLAEVLSEARTRETRLNQGVVGRGERLLNGTQKQRVRRLAEYYSAVDFSWIGLPNSISTAETTPS
jgi:hypothetical protein